MKFSTRDILIPSKIINQEEHADFIPWSIIREAYFTEDNSIEYIMKNQHGKTNKMTDLN